MHFSTLLGAAATLAGAANASPVSRRAAPVGQAVFQCTQPGLVALTFDDGPFTFTPRLLDILKQNDVKATFFVNANNWASIYDNADTIRRMRAEGHQVASHTGTHPDLETLSTADRQAQMKQLEDATQSIDGFKPRYMRPPYLSCGAGCQSDLGALGYVIVDTNLDTKDFENNSPELIQNSVNKFDSGLSADPTSNSYIVLHHDVHEQTVVTLVQKEIDTLRAKGYRAVTAGECLGDAPANWYQ